MKLMQCWDDGVTTDVRLVSLLRRHGARATFNLNAGLHARERRFGWQHQGTEVWRLGHDELREVYAGFTIANHTLTHPHLAQLPLDGARREIVDGRARQQDLFGQPVRGFVYPFGTFDAAVAQAVRDAGHCHARTTQAADCGVDTHDGMAASSSCHFLAPDFWQRFERARPGGVFWFRGPLLRAGRRHDVGRVRGLPVAPVRGAGGAVVRPNRPVHRKPGFNLPPCPLPTRTQALLVCRLALLVLTAAAFGTPLTQAADFASQWPACAP